MDYKELLILSQDNEDQQELETGVKTIPVSDLSEEEWQIAKSRYDIIAPIINYDTTASIESVAKCAGIGRATIFRWLQKYNSTKSVSSLVRLENNGGRGASRLPEEVENIISSAIEERFLTNQKLTVKKISLEIAAKCKIEGIDAPHYLTIRNRVNNISREELLARRYRRSIANNKCKPLEGKFPEADYPLAAVQIDHTPLDIICVDH